MSWDKAAPSIGWGHDGCVFLSFADHLTAILAEMIEQFCRFMEQPLPTGHRK
jgi:hypothetical protein